MASRNGHRVQAITIIIGMPASGKSTLMKHLMELTNPWRFDNTTKYLPMHYSNYRPSVILGRYDDSRHPFPGTDRMSMACQAHALKFIQMNPDKDFIMEGDRLGNQKFILSLCNHTDAHITVIHLVNGARTAVARMRSSQTDTFRRSRKTKLDNIDRLCQGLAQSTADKAPSIDYHVVQNDSSGECHALVLQLTDKRSLDSPLPIKGVI